MVANKLLLNDDINTDLIYVDIYRPNQREPIPLNSSVNMLGLIFDEHLDTYYVYGGTFISET